MNFDLVLLSIINILSGMGYSILAPLFPTITKEKSIGDDIVGLAISIFAISNLAMTPFCPWVIKKCGRRTVFFSAVILEAICTFSYGFLDYFENYYLFVGVTYFIRLVHGVGCAFSSTLVYSSAAYSCDPGEVKVSLGYIEVAWCVGLTFGPACASFFYYLGGYPLPFIVVGLVLLACIPSISKLKLPEDTEGSEAMNFSKSLFDYDIITLFFTVVIDNFSRTYYYPILTNHLRDKFGLTIESSSIFFMLPMIMYFSVLHCMNAICNAISNKLTIATGLLIISVAVTMLPPISIWPHHYIVILLGLIIIGIPGALINIPAVVDLIDTLKLKNPKFDEGYANDMASAIFNLGINFGESIGPTYGGVMAQYYDFNTSSFILSMVSVFYTVIFVLYNLKSIKNHFKPKSVEMLIEGSYKEKMIDEESQIQKLEHETNKTRSSVILNDNTKSF